MQKYQAGEVVQSQKFGNYDMGRGKCRLNGVATKGYKITNDEHLNVAACALDCDMNFNCKAFHFYTKDRMKGRGACVVWFDDGLTPNRESDSDCYMKKSATQSFLNKPSTMTKNQRKKSYKYTPQYPKQQYRATTKYYTSYYKPVISVPKVYSYFGNDANDAFNQLT